MPLTHVIPWFDFRQPALRHARHPTLGDYVFGQSPDEWLQRREAIGGAQTFVLAGYGTSPTDEQVSLWRGCEERLLERFEIAVQLIPEPPFKLRKQRFLRSDLSLREVRLEPNGSIEFWFSTPIMEEIEMSPFVVFEGNMAIVAEWSS